MNHQRGASAVVVTGALLLLMGMAAFAIDYSAALNERRQDVGAADTAALGGILEGALSTAPNALQVAVDQAKAIADANTPSASTAAQWSACTDPSPLHWSSTNPTLGVAGGSPCISFSRDFTTIRVNLPLQQVPTTFGRVLGVTEIETTAAAEATIASTLGEGGGFPTGVFAGTAAGTQLCVKTGTGGKDTCGDPSTGDFGNFQPYFYTELAAGNPTSQCNAGNAPAPLARAMADGIDHVFGLASGVGAGNRVNGAWCPSTPGPAFPNRVDSGSGYSSQDVTDGLILGGSFDGSFAGRLDRGPFQGGGFTVFGRTIDNAPLWTFIRSGSGLAGTCQTVRQLPAHPSLPTTIGGTTIADWDAAKALMGQCLADEAGPLFTSAILNSPRLAGVPVFHQTAPLGSNACCYDIAGFAPIFIESFYTAHGNQWTCTGDVFVSADDTFCRHDAGMQGEIDRSGGPGQRRVDSASGLLLRCANLPPDVCQTITIGGSTTIVFLGVELTR